LLIYERVRAAAGKDAICQQIRKAANETLSALSSNILVGRYQ